jgi:hypothetical protein
MTRGASERSFRDRQVLKPQAFYAEQWYETVGRVYGEFPPQCAALEREGGEKRAPC